MTSMQEHLNAAIAAMATVRREWSEYSDEHETYIADQAQVAAHNLNELAKLLIKARKARAHNRSSEGGK